jgi:hypothetical protein
MAESPTRVLEDACTEAAARIDQATTELSSIFADRRFGGGLGEITELITKHYPETQNRLLLRFTEELVTASKALKRAEVSLEELRQSVKSA